MNEQTLYQLGRFATRLYSQLALDSHTIQHAPVLAGAKIIAPNHPTTLDPFLVPAYVEEQVHILVTESAFKVPLFGAYLRRAGHVPVLVNNGRAAFDHAQRLLCEGRTIAVFPEGALSPLDGSIGQARTGVVRLALMTGAPVIPVGIGLEVERIRNVNTGIMTDEGVPEIARLYLNGAYVVTIGAPMMCAGNVDDHAYVRSLSQKLMERIHRLSRLSAAHLRAVVRQSAYDTGEFPRL